MSLMRSSSERLSSSPRFNLANEYEDREKLAISPLIPESPSDCFPAPAVDRIAAADDEGLSALDLELRFDFWRFDDDLDDDDPSFVLESAAFGLAAAALVAAALVAAALAAATFEAETFEAETFEAVAFEPVALVAVALRVTFE
jgi:hypothetical protein